MQYLFEFVLITNFMFQIILCETINCQISILEPEEIFFVKKDNTLIIQSDENDLQALNYGNYDIIKESLRSKNVGSEEIISTQMIEINNIFSVFDKLFCLFKKSDYYFITCIKVKNINEDGRENFIEQNKLQIFLNVKVDNKCDQFYFQENFEFIVFCFQDLFLKLYSIDFENKTKLLVQFNIEQDNRYTLCKRKYFIISDQHYLIAFFQCQNWGVFTYYNEQLNVTLNEQIAQNNYSQQINYLENIDLCQQNQLFLITETNYFTFIIYENNSLTFQIVFKNFLNLKQVLLSQTCNPVYHIHYISSVNKTVIKKKNIQLELEGTNFNINLFRDILFVQNNNQLLIIYDKQLQQIININHSQFYFDNQFNLIFQIDLIANEILFYRFSYPRNFIKSSKKYIYMIYSQSLLQAYNYFCFEIQYILKTPQLIQNFNLINICQNQSIIQLSKQSFNLIGQYYIQLPLNHDLNISIFDNSSFNLFCRNLNNFNHIDQTLVYYQSDNQKSFTLTKTKNYIHYQSCDGQLLHQIKTQQNQVFQYGSSIFMWLKDKKILRQTIFLATQPENFEYRFKSEIINILQFLDIIIVFTQNREEIQLFDLCTASTLMIDQKIKNILANLNQMYLQTQKETQQFQAFYFVKYQPQLIQFNQYLIIDNHSQIHWIEIGSIQIVVLRIILSSKYYILGVHLINNLIIEQILIEDQISILNKIDLNDYEIIRPLEYQINYYYNYLAIATKKLTKTYILLFAVSIKFPLKQYKIIEIGRVQFFFVQEFLFYYDQDDNIYKYNTKDFEIQIDNLLLEQNDLTNIKQIQFQIIPINSNDSIMNVEISIKSYNECFKLLKKQNDVLLKFISQKELKFNINDYIYGPINNVQIINNNHIKIQGPMLLYEIINNQEILKDAKLQTINLGSQFPGVQNIINIILFKYKSNLIILFDKSIQSQIKNKAHLQNIIQFNDKSLLVLFLNKNRNEIRGSIHMINETTLQLESEPIFEIIINFPLHFNCQSFKTGNLIIIKAQNTIDIYQIIGYSIQQIQNHLNILEILKIKGNNELYISLSLNTKNNQQILLFQILSLDQLEFQVKGTASLTWNSMDIVLKNQIYLHPNQKLNYDYQLIFLECSIADEKLQITILQAFQEYLVICEIIIFMEDFKISYRPIKILRNPENLNQDLEYEYFNQNNLILKQFNLIYFYDLLEQSNLYHYIGKQFLERQYLFHQFNTTHFIVYDCIQQKMFFANIGYLIKINDEVLENQVFTLIAENKVSSIQLQISLEVFNDQIQNQNFITKFFLFFVYYQFCIFFQEE